MAVTKGRLMSAGSHLPHLLHLVKIQSEGCRANSNSLECQYSAVRARAILSLQVLLNKIFSHLRYLVILLSLRWIVPRDRVKILVVKEISYCNIF